jgi:putative transposase
MSNKYDIRVKYLISKTKNPKLFPELQIPVSTAKYWIKQRIHLTLSHSLEKSKSTQLLKLKKENLNLRKENKNLRIKLRIIKQIQRILNFSPTTKDIDVKKRVVSLIKENKKQIGVYKTLKDLNISISKYKRWRKEISLSNSQKLKNVYSQNHPKSLTSDEIRMLKKLYTSKKLFHFPLEALSVYSKKQNLLHCSTATWRKYANILNLKRPKLRKFYNSEYKVGINKKYPNQLWHIDVTEIKVNHKKKVFLQVLIDNHSKHIVGWQLINQWSGQYTVDLIRKAIRKYQKPIEIMSDAGSENLNSKVISFLDCISIRFTVSKIGTFYSNSKVEVFFRTLKSNFLSKVSFTTTKKLKEYIRFYIRDYNQKIPHSSLNMRTPEEAYFGMGSKYYKFEMRLKAKKVVRNRISTYWKN